MAHRNLGDREKRDSEDQEAKFKIKRKQIVTLKYS